MNARLVDTIKKYNNICWYLSAGGDFRPLLFLSEVSYSDYSQHFWDEYPEEDRVIPDLFVFTDIMANKPFDYTKNEKVESDLPKLNTDNWGSIRKIYNDEYTDIRVNTVARFNNVVGTDSKNMFDNESDINISDNYGSAFLMNISVYSKKFGKEHRWNVDVLYVLGANAFVAKELFLKNDITVRSAVEIRYIGTYGGKKLFGQWVKSLFRYLGTEYFIGNKEYIEKKDTEYNLDVKTLKDVFYGYDLSRCPDLSVISCVPQKLWNNRSTVKWSKVIV
ncbi:hypothetical protein SAMN02910369_02445 [Lachnospiraceae bacterium NE2001]|nr:hypothetical protein SAMN02910369_02445 [Lachnospiraceae bacterium NE2001]